jgi:signal transduction histidine kinase
VSSSRPGHGSSRRRTRPDAGSGATCTTARSSVWSRSDSSSATSGRACRPGSTTPWEQLSRVSEILEEVLENLRELSRGVHPAILSQGGLVPALKALARRSPLPVELHTDVDGRLPERVEIAAYYLVSEALTNAAKHSKPSAVEVRTTAGDGSLELSVHDDGVGGADPARGSGLVGMRDRATALGGSLEIASPVGEGTRMTARLPTPARLIDPESSLPRSCARTGIRTQERHRPLP